MDHQQTVRFSDFVSLRIHPPRGDQLLRAFNLRAMRYNHDAYVGLLSSTSTIVSEEGYRNTIAGLGWIADYITTTVALYGELAAGIVNDRPLLGMLEFGLSDAEIAWQRESAALRELPSLGRLDCVALGEDHVVTEIQWKGAGEGYAASTEDAYQQVFPLDGHIGFNNLIEGWATALGGDVNINTGIRPWEPSEEYLKKALIDRGIDYEFRSAEDVSQSLRCTPTGTYLTDGRRVGLLYLDRLSESFNSEDVSALLSACRSSKLRLDPPPSYIFNQKLPLWLPFAARYASRYSDRVRRALIPSSLIASPFDFSAVLPFLTDSAKRDLTAVKAAEDLLTLSSATMKQLIIKCGSADRYLNHGGHGVYRLDLADNHQMDQLREILHRIGKGEPWLVQPYLGKTATVPVSFVDAPAEIIDQEVHGKFGVYFKILPTLSDVSLIGGIATYGLDWKVSGASGTRATRCGSRNVKGAFRNDIRVSRAL